MTQQQAAAFIGAMNTVQAYVPPILWERLVTSPVCAEIVGVANGALELKAVAPEPEKAD